MRTKAQKWGNSLAVRVPRAIAAELGLRTGDELEIEVAGDRVVLRRARGKPRYRLEDLVRSIRASERYREEDFGKRRGREAW